jgi:hypothetical protein
MFSMAAASAVLPFLPMLPSQILLNNLLYDTSQLTIPTDRVDPEQPHAPSHWDIGMIRRFMLFFGPISSLFDFLTFALMLGVFHAGPELFAAAGSPSPWPPRRWSSSPSTPARTAGPGPSRALAYPARIAARRRGTASG